MIRLLRLLASMEFAIALLLYGAVFSAVAALSGVSGSRLEGAIWLNALFALFAVNLGACAIGWIPRVTRAMRPQEPVEDPAALRSMPGARERAAGEMDLDHLAEVLGRHGFEVRRTGRTALAAERHRRVHLGFFLTHMAFILIFGGSLAGRILGESGRIAILEGQTAREITLDEGRRLSLPFALRLDDFRMEHYMDLEVVAPGGPETLRVRVEAGGDIGLPRGAGRLRIDAIHPNAVVMDDGRIVNRSRDFLSPVLEGTFVDASGREEPLRLTPLRPAVVAGSITLRLLIDPSHPVKDWISELTLQGGNRDGETVAIRVNHPLTYEGWKFYQMDYDHEALQYTILMARRDPGVPFVYAGYFVLVAGIFLVVFFSHRRVMAVYTGEDGGRLVIAPWTYRNRGGADAWLEPVWEEAGGKGGETC